ncbi:MAG: hypothetical protein ACYTG5_09665 [Planctomycetota bacterium]|jgi:hypothetical protein
MRKSQMIGLILWRGGLLFVAAALLYEGARWALFFLDIPDQIKVGLGLAIAGAILVVLSFIAERIVDARAEGELRE